MNLGRNKKTRLIKNSFLGRNQVHHKVVARVKLDICDKLEESAPEEVFEMIHMSLAGKDGYR